MSSTTRERSIHRDNYQTPVWCVDIIIRQINWMKVQTVHEPCAGDGNIYKLIKQLALASYCEIMEGTDYLAHDGLSCDLIITNPPFSQAMPFLEKSLKEAKTVIYLLRLDFLASKKRKPFWDANQISHLYPLSRRPSFTGKGTDSCDYGWFVWGGAGVMKDPVGVKVL